MKDGYRLLVPFVTNDHKFSLGFEMGVLYAELREKPDRLETMIHADNDEQLIVMASNLKYLVSFEDVGDGWMRAFLARTE